MNPVDQWITINAKYFPTEQVQYIRQRLEALPEQQLGLGVGKLLTCGGCGIWSIVDLFLIMDATRQSNAQKLFAVIG